MLINPDKRKLLMLGTPEYLCVTLLGKKIFPGSSTNDLGEALDSCWSYTISMTSRRMFVFQKLFHCSTVWANASKQNKKKLQSVQNFAALIFTVSKKFDHITPLLKQLYWLPVNVPLRFRDVMLA